MKEYLPFLVVGLASGSVYALAALGLVVTYKTSGIFNFAHGAIGMISTFVFYSLRHDAGVPAAVAVAVVVLVLAPALGVLVDRVLLRRLVGAPAATYVVTSLGLLVALQGLAIVLYGAESRQVAPFLPTSTFRLPGVNVGWDQALIVVIAAACALGLATFFKRSHLGVETRAVVDDADLTQMTAVDDRRVTAFSWALGYAFAAMSGILLAPLVGLDAAILTLLVVSAFGAAAVGRLTSLPLTYVGALAIGVAQAVSTKLVASHPQLAGVPSSLPFVALFLVLVISRKGSLVEVTKVRLSDRRRTSGRRHRLPLPAVAAGFAIAAVVPWVVSGSHLLSATVTLVFILIFASLSLLVGLSRQVSLCHAVFVGLGATTLAHLLDSHVPFGLALLLAGLAVVPIGALVAIPAIRLSGLFLALATFGFGILVQSLIFSSSLGFGNSGVVSLARPSLFSGDKAYYLLVLAIVAAGVVAIEVLYRTRLGRLLRAIADSQRAVESVGINPTASRVIVFCASAFLAAIAGGLLGALFRSVNPVSFDFFQSLVWLTVLVTAGAATLSGSVVAAVLFAAVPAIFTSSKVTEYQPIFFGVMAMLLAQAPNGLVGLVRVPDFAQLARASRWRLASSRYRQRVDDARRRATADILADGAERVA